MVAARGKWGEGDAHGVAWQDRRSGLRCGHVFACRRIGGAWWLRSCPMLFFSIWKLLDDHVVLLTTTLHAADGLILQRRVLHEVARVGLSCCHTVAA